jgi:uncharacterized protein YbjT (DUF2867 family)
MDKSIKVIVTGATGMVGEGVLHECLLHPLVEEVLIINRRPSGIVHPKLKEMVHKDFFAMQSISGQLRGYDACFFCLGVSSVGMKEADYYRATYILTMHVAETLAAVNPELVFCYVSGAGTDSTEMGKSMWARVKGKTENDLQKKGLGKVYNFRPALITPTPGLKNTLSMYKWLGWLIPVIRSMAPNAVISLAEIGKAMINAVIKGYPASILEVKDIRKLAGNA